MRMNLISNDGVLQRNKVGKGGTLTDYLTLVTEPVVPLDAATKRYVDSLFSQLSTDNIVSGQITPAHLPAMLGDAVSAPGTNEVNLAPITSSGQYTKPVVNSKGLVISGGAIGADDVPDLDWSLVSDGHPTDAIGYGIKDAIGDNGGSVNVNITLFGPPTQPSHAATKKYVDDTVLTGGGAGLSVGDIMLKLTDATPVGFLRCNGSLVSKTDYTNLYNVLKTDYEARMLSGAGKPWVQQQQINLNNNLDLSVNTAGGLLAASSAYAQVAVTRNKVFLLGGSNGFNLSNIQTASINSDGSLGNWSNLGMGLPSGMKNFQVVLTKNRLYLLAGVAAGNSNNAVLYSPIDSYGNLGAWVTDGTLPHGVSGHRAFITSSRLYILGGSLDGNVTATNKTYYSPINEDGSLGTWVQGPDLPTPNQFFSIAVTGDKLHIIGGHTGSVTLSAISSATIGSDGSIGEFTSSSFLPQSRALSQCFVTDKYAYLMGGTRYNGLTSVASEIMRSPIAPDGGLGSWSVVAGSCPIKGGEVVSLLNHIHVLGGINSSESFLNTTLKYSTNNSGGLNDYYDYYNNPMFTPNGADYFSLPDAQNTELAGVYLYIKY